MLEKYEVAIIDLNLVISEKPSPIKMQSKLPVSTVEFIGIVECIYIIVSVLEFSIKFLLKITDNLDFFALWRTKLLLDILFYSKPGRMIQGQREGVRRLHIVSNASGLRTLFLSCCCPFTQPRMNSGDPAAVLRSEILNLR